MSSARRDPIAIVEYDDTWPSLFARERVRIERVLGSFLLAPVEHIGSTSVPGLPAKPIIDMLALVADYDDAAATVEALAGIGWVVAEEPGDRERRRRSFCTPSVAWRTHHLHLWEVTAAWRPLLAFRDHLRADDTDRDRYAALKRTLAVTHPDDRPAYRSGKAPLIAEILAKISA